MELIITSTSIAQAMRLARERERLSQESVAMALGVSPMSLSRCERGESRVGALQLAALSVLYNARLEQLFSLESLGDKKYYPDYSVALPNGIIVSPRQEVRPEREINIAGMSRALVAWRTWRGFGKGEVAYRLVIARNTLSSDESGIVDPRAIRLLAYAKLYEVSLELAYGLGIVDYGLYRDVEVLVSER